MSTLFWKFIAFLCKAFLSLRYRIEVKGLDTLDRLKPNEGILFLPNHPANVDPFINFVYFWPKYRMRPMVIDYIFDTTFLKPFHKIIGSIPIPNLENAVNEYKQKLAEKAFRQVADGLKKGDNFMVYPAGRLKNSGKELLGGASGAHELLKECPNVNVVLVRMTGLWGSSTSRAIIGRTPPLMDNFWLAFRTLLKNCIFFTPRRKVTVEIAANPEDMPRDHESRIQLNRYLEGWYNRYLDDKGTVRETEPAKLVSYSWWRQDVPKVFRQERKQNNNSGIHVSEETKRKIYNEIRKILEKPELEIKPEMNLAFDLGMDSLNIAEFITYVTKYFDVAELHPEDLETVGTVLEIAEGGNQAQISKEPPPDYTWASEKNRPSPTLPLGNTIPEAFLNSCLRMNGYAACGDDNTGVIGYKRIKKAVLVLAQYFKTWEEDRIAIMLPASIGAYIAILAVQFAGKTPVMINWTLGSRYIEGMMELSGAKRIVTSWKFLDRLANVQFGKCLDKLVLLEEVRKKLTLPMKLRGVFLTKLSIPSVLKSMRLDQINENDPCVILFTSGTEAVPKGVPLSHKNIISNQRSAMQCIDTNANDVLYGILPPFHSFGFSVAGLFPLLGGIRVAFYPDPTDGFALAEGVQRWKITMFCAAPSFLKGLFHAAKGDELKTIRYFVSGAEKTPEELYKRVEQMGHAKLLEGYGITECSPILSLNRPNMVISGVGRLAPDIEMITIHPETLKLLPHGADGEICVRGPNVFSGYLGNPRSPFIEFNGKKWYRTGDLGHLDENECLVLSGRLKRFTKLGGEMISLGAIEDVLAKHFIQEGKISPNIPSLAVIADEREEGKSKLLLFIIIDVEKDEVNQILLNAGFSNLVKISGVKKVDDIPLMGAGKTDYRSLQALC
ncbi:MAG: AMP-binding protein [Parachlamydiales bacterium]|nr:AMP-binding protein [Parachlamydiales bacterium]